MDSGHEGISWVGKVVHTFEALRIEVHHFISQSKTLRRVENQLRIVGENVSGFYEELVEDILSPIMGDSGKRSSPDSPSRSVGVAESSRSETTVDALKAGSFDEREGNLVASGTEPYQKRSELERGLPDLEDFVYAAETGKSHDSESDEVWTANCPGFFIIQQSDEVLQIEIAS